MHHLTTIALKSFLALLFNMPFVFITYFLLSSLKIMFTAPMLLAMLNFETTLFLIFYEIFIYFKTNHFAIPIAQFFDGYPGKLPLFI